MDSLPSCQRLAAHIGWELIVVHRKAGDMLARWQGRWANNLVRYRDLACVKLILPWSTPSMRFCTSELKTAVIASALKKRFAGLDILNITGVRRQESSSRSRLPVLAPMPRLTRKNAAGMSWNAILEWRLDDVLESISESGLALHDAYTKYGASRVSCAFCIMSSESDLMAAAGCDDNRDLYRLMVELEADSTFGFQGKRWLADVAPVLLTAALRERIHEAKRKAILRQNIEAELPAHLLFTQGWPTAMPTDDEADLIASVRLRISELLGISAKHLTGDSVRARYAELMAAHNAKKGP
jgi:3'-phosphoadenosine 5'-phosphosulfate sulfotransferase (PAPS reductase)/FAD synthetase